MVLGRFSGLIVYCFIKETNNKNYNHVPCEMLKSYGRINNNLGFTSIHSNRKETTMNGKRPLIHNELGGNDYRGELRYVVTFLAD